VDAAKGLHKAAQQYYAKARYDRAIASWSDAYNFDCRAHRLLINIGNAYEKLGQTDKAIEAFETYLVRAGDGADPTIADKVENLKQLAAKPDPQPQPKPDPTPKPGPKPDPNGNDGKTNGGGPGALPWVVVGIGAATTIAGAVLLGVGTKKISDAEVICPDHDSCNDESARSLGNEGLGLQNAGAAVLAIGVVAVGAGLVWFFVSDSGDDPGSAKAGALLPSLVVTPGFIGAGLQGRF
jgi:tetratricopeptide (TPR) repeat protein